MIYAVVKKGGHMTEATHRSQKEVERELERIERDQLAAAYSGQRQSKVRVEL